MAKTWQYGRWRGVALQAVMWLIFGSSLGLAAYIDHRRSGDLRIQLAEPQAVGRLIVRLPRGWEVEQESGPPQAIVAEDFDPQGRRRRTLKITLEQQTGRKRGAQVYLESLLNFPDHPQVAPAPEPFDFLGQSGVLMPQRFPAEALEQITRDPADAGLYACVVLPDGYTVTLQLIGDRTYGPSGRALLGRVADGMRLADR